MSDSSAHIATAESLEWASGRIDRRQHKVYRYRMGIIRRVVTVLAFFTLLATAGINWRTIWMEPNPLYLPSPGSSVSYVVKGINGMNDTQWDLTHSPYLKVTSSDDSIVAVDQTAARLIAKRAGRAEIRISFSECTSINSARVDSK